MSTCVFVCRSVGGSRCWVPNREFQHDGRTNETYKAHKMQKDLRQETYLTTVGFVNTKKSTRFLVKKSVHINLGPQPIGRHKVCSSPQFQIYNQQLSKILSHYDFQPYNYCWWFRNRKANPPGMELKTPVVNHGKNMEKPR